MTFVTWAVDEPFAVAGALRVSIFVTKSQLLRFVSCKISAPHISAGVGLRGVKNVAAIGAGRWPAIHYCAKRGVSDVVSIGSHHAHGLSGRVERGVKELSIRSPRETGVPVYAVHARRSEERRVGKECRPGAAPYNYNKRQ